MIIDTTTTVLGADDLADYLAALGAEYSRSGLDFNVSGPEDVLDSLCGRQDSLSFPFYDPSH